MPVFLWGGPFKAQGKFSSMKHFYFSLCVILGTNRSNKQSKLSKTCAWYRDSLVKSAVECERLFCDMDVISISKSRICSCWKLYNPVLLKKTADFLYNISPSFGVGLGREGAMLLLQLADRSLIIKVRSRLPLECRCEAALCLIHQHFKLGLCIWKHWHWRLFNEFECSYRMIFQLTWYIMKVISSFSNCASDLPFILFFKPWFP